MCQLARQAKGLPSQRLAKWVFHGLEGLQRFDAMTENLAARTVCTASHDLHAGDICTENENKLCGARGS